MGAVPNNARGPFPAAKGPADSPVYRFSFEGSRNLGSSCLLPAAMIMCRLCIGTVRPDLLRTVPIHNLHIIMVMVLQS